MEFHGFHTDEQLRRDLAAWFANQDEVKHLALAPGEQREPLRATSATAVDTRFVRPAVQRVQDLAKQLIAVEWLFDEIVRALFHRFDGHRYVAVPGDEDDRSPDFPLPERPPRP